MNTKITGKAFVLGDNIDTDQVIPVQHLVSSLADYEESRNYGKYVLSGTPIEQAGLPGGGIPFVAPNAVTSQFEIVIAGKNLGCGSSREHVPAALAIAGAKAIVAFSYARVFYRNAVDGGFLVPYESLDDLSREIGTYDELEIDQELNELHNLTTGKIYRLQSLGNGADIVTACAIFNYARKYGIVK